MLYRKQRRLSKLRLNGDRDSEVETVEVGRHVGLKQKNADLGGDTATRFSR
jgi:hypothetical protein